MLYIEYAQNSCSLSEPAEKMIIRKAKPLLTLWKSPLSLPEFKILDLYLSRIDFRYPEKRLVHFSKEEIEQSLNLTYLKPEHLKERLRNLCLTIDISDAEYSKGFNTASLFERAVCRPDADGIWQVELECTSTAMEHLFNINGTSYVEYELQTIRNLKSRHTYILFLYLEQNRFRGSWEADLSDLREMLGCSTEFYDSYKQFNEHILRRSQAELKEKSEYVFSYTPIRNGRHVRKIYFQVGEEDSCALSESMADAENNESSHSADTHVGKHSPTNKSERMSIVMTPELKQKIKMYCATHKVTVANVFEEIFQNLLNSDKK